MQGPESPVVGGGPALATVRSQQAAVVAEGGLSDGLIVTHVPDLSSLGLLMQ